MKKFAAVLLAIGVCFAVVACGGGGEEIKEKNKEPVTAKDVVDFLADNELPIGKVVVYDANTDPNGLLGRPNQYTSKVNFEDTRHPIDTFGMTEQEMQEQMDTFDDPWMFDPVNSIEVFENEADMKSRKSYLEGLTQGSSRLGEYDYANQYVLFGDWTLKLRQTRQRSNEAVICTACLVMSSRNRREIQAPLIVGP